jgi:phosphopantetheine adenylyltransferase
MRKHLPGSHYIRSRGHKRGISLFDEIAIGVNAEKYMFPLEERKRFIERPLR